MAALNEPEDAWIRFAKKHKAESHLQEPPLLGTDYYFKVIKSGDFQANFIWGVKTGFRSAGITTATHFFFDLPYKGDYTLNIYDNNFMNRFMLFFSMKTERIGDNELDRRFVFSSNDMQLTKELLNELKPFVELIKRRVFSIKIIVEGRERDLSIQLTSLLNELDSIEAFYKAGSNLRDAIIPREG